MSSEEKFEKLLGIFLNVQDQIYDLKRYLHSNKFHENTTVQTGDVLNRIHEMEGNLTAVADLCFSK